jgi:hypothetical protein
MDACHCEWNVLGGRVIYLDLHLWVSKQGIFKLLTMTKLHFLLPVQSSQVWRVGNKGNTFILYNTPMNYNNVYHTSKLQKLMQQINVQKWEKIASVMLGLRFL